jgi:2-polyprenyl-6-hydroxyphenyl methylase/3-demethylubiquinone-9 3-methyltransferase
MNSNVDHEEVNKFAALAARWWDRDSEFKPLHDINPLRLNYIKEQCGGSLEGKRILDVGCGGGILSESLALEGATVVGIDLAEAGLEVAKLLEMLEHVPDPSLVIEACSKLIKPNGQIFFSTINRNPKSYFFAIVGAEYVLNLLPKGTHNYEKFIRPSEIDGWARPYGLSISSMIGMTYNPITKKYKLGDDVSVNYIVHYKKK